MTVSFKGEIIWIIGASSGIGEALAKQLDVGDATLCLSARRAEVLNALNLYLGEAHQVYPLDVTDAAAVQAAMQAIIEKNGRIDRILFLAGHYMPMPMQDLEMKHIRPIIETNLLGAFHVVAAAEPVLRRQNHGQLALCGSVAGFRGLPRGQPYSATKAGIINLAETLRAEWPEAIDIKLINPGFVRTPMTAKNTFRMPMLISADDAAIHIVKKLKSRCFEIIFPALFGLIMKLVQRLPDPLFFFLARKM